MNAPKWDASLGSPSSNMESIFIFAISGTAIATLIAAKSLEVKIRRPLFIFRWIMKSDKLIRDWHHKTLEFYSGGKEKVSFFFTRQIKIHSKNTFNKLVAFLKEKREQYENNMRNSKLLKKPDGISEFFKNMSDIEKGNGSIDETFEDACQNDVVGPGSQNVEERVK